MVGRCSGAEGNGFDGETKEIEVWSPGIITLGAELVEVDASGGKEQAVEAGDGSGMVGSGRDVPDEDLAGHSFR